MADKPNKPYSEPGEKQWTSAFLGRISEAVAQVRFAHDHVPVPSSLFHYTTAEGLKGIIEENALRASAACYLNDSSEIKYGCNLLASVLSEWTKANKGIDCAATRIMRQMCQISEQRDAKANNRVFIACFCQNGNLLSQWRTYGQTGGYSIEFPTDRLGLFALKPNGQYYSWNFAKVAYDRTAQTQRLHHILKAVLSIVDDPEIEAHVAATPANQMNVLHMASWLLSEWLTDEIVSFKNPAFAEEQEWRIMIRDTVVYSPEAPSNIFAKVHFRTHRGLLIPYIKLLPTGSALLPIQSVRYGPSLEKAKTRASLVGFLENHGYKDIPLEGADIPVQL